MQLEHPKNNELVSIVMPVFNTSLYLEECINSIIAQTYENWELIAVNDFSTDNSFAMLQDFARKDNRIKVFQNDKKGIIPALQNAYSHSSGNLISRMDSDDIMLPNKIEVLTNLLYANGKGNIAVGPVKYFADYPIGSGFQQYETWLNSLIKSGTNFTEIYKECVIPSPSWLCFSTDFEQVGGFNSNIYPEDYDLVFRFYANGLKCLPCDETVHLWRDYQNRTSRTDPNYADASFIDLKMFYFLKLDYNPNRPLLLWGAGSKGKKIAKILQQNKIDFTWICDNKNKIGKDIYGVILENHQNIRNIKLYQSLISIASPEAKSEIKKEFNKLNLVSMKDYYFLS